MKPAAARKTQGCAARGPAPPPQPSAQPGGSSRATQETPSSALGRAAEPAGNTAQVSVPRPLHRHRRQTPALPALRRPGSEKPPGAPCWPSLSTPRTPPLPVCGARAPSAGRRGNSRRVEGQGRSAEALKVLWATQPGLRIGTGLRDRAWGAKKSCPSPFLRVKNESEFITVMTSFVML